MSFSITDNVEFNGLIGQLLQNETTTFRLMKEKVSEAFVKAMSRFMQFDETTFDPSRDVFVCHKEGDKEPAIEGKCYECKKPSRYQIEVKSRGPVNETTKQKIQELLKGNIKLNGEEGTLSQVIFKIEEPQYKFQKAAASNSSDPAAVEEEDFEEVEGALFPVSVSKPASTLPFIPIMERSPRLVDVESRSSSEERDSRIFPSPGRVPLTPSLAILREEGLTSDVEINELVYSLEFKGFQVKIESTSASQCQIVVHTEEIEDSASIRGLMDALNTRLQEKKVTWRHNGSEKHIVSINPAVQRKRQYQILKELKEKGVSFGMQREKGIEGKNTLQVFYKNTEGRESTDKLIEELKQLIENGEEVRFDNSPLQSVRNSSSSSPSRRSIEGFTPPVKQ